MKCSLSLIFFILLCVYININFVYSVDKRWRRAEIIISGIKDRLKRNYGNERFIEINVNGVKKYYRKILNSPPDDDPVVDFGMHQYIYDYGKDLDPNGFFVTEPLLIPTIFENPLTLNFVLWLRLNHTTIIPGVNETATQDFRCAANADRLMRSVQLTKDITFDIYVSFRCHGYHGLGCRFLCDVGNDVPYECLYDSNETVCKDPNFINPPECNITSVACEVNPCLNGGTCVKQTPSISYCDCPPGFIGKTCEFAYCSTPCNPDNGYCVGSNKCECKPGWEGDLCDQVACNSKNNACANNASCLILGNEVYCSCDTSRFCGKFCSLECNPQCIFGTCVESEGTAMCQCYDGFIGDLCDEPFQIPINFDENDYISDKYQSIGYAVTVVSLILFGVILFFYGSRVRKNKMESKIGNKLGLDTKKNSSSKIMENQQTLEIIN